MTNKDVFWAITIGVIIGTCIVIITSPITKNQKVQECFDKPSDTGVELCLKWVKITE